MRSVSRPVAVAMRLSLQRHASTTASVPSSSSVQVVARSKCFGGETLRLKHRSALLNTDMAFAVHMPPQDTAANGAFPVLYWLSGLTCDDTNFIFKAGAQQHLSRHGIMVVCPDTSPRDANLPNEKDSYDFGYAASFYLTPTTPGYKDKYKMFEYLTQEMPKFIDANFPTQKGNMGIFGHSMGGLGALNLFLKTKNLYKSVSAFSPICNPTNCPWGRKAFTGYLGTDESTWKAWDPAELLKKANLDQLPPILISQGSSDQFLKEQLKPESLPKHPKIKLNMCDGYDHSYYFISTFIEEHIKHHAAILKK